MQINGLAEQFPRRRLRRCFHHSHWSVHHRRAMMRWPTPLVLKKPAMPQYARDLTPILAE